MNSCMKRGSSSSRAAFGCSIRSTQQKGTHKPRRIHIQDLTECSIQKYGLAGRRKVVCSFTTCLNRMASCQRLKERMLDHELFTSPARSQQNKSTDQSLSLSWRCFRPVGPDNGRADRRRNNQWRTLQYLDLPGSIRDRGYQLHRMHGAQRHGGKGMN